MGVFRFFRRAQWDDERANELEDYLARERDDNIARGMTPDEAGYAARRKLGNRTRIREEIYVPYTSRATEEDRRVPAAMTLMVRTTLDRAPTDALIRRVVSSLSQESSVPCNPGSQRGTRVGVEARLRRSRTIGRGSRNPPARRSSPTAPSGSASAAASWDRRW
jgi:hypothetical protein